MYPAPDKLPAWFKQEIPDQRVFERLNFLTDGLKVSTVCREAKCPNLSNCFNKGELTFIILGKTCTRNCKFCAVTKSSGRKLSLDDSEPLRISRAVKALSLTYAVVTSVTRDDLIDGGAGHFARTISLIRAMNSDVKIEALIPDFLGDKRSLNVIISSGCAVIAHNLETVRRLSAELRPESDYQRSLTVLKVIKEIDPKITTKSSLMLGLGERESEVKEALSDLRMVACDIIVLGQYLAPDKSYFPVKEFISLEQFKKYRDFASNLGFKAVLSEPLARSSYQAEEIYNKIRRLDGSKKEEELCMI